MDPSKREEEPLSKSWKDYKSDINGKGLNNLRQVKEIKQRESPNLNSAGSESSNNNRTDIAVHVLSPLLGADSKQDVGNRSGSQDSKERSSTNKGGGGGQYEPGKGKERGVSVSVIPSVSFDNSITVIKHLKQSEVSKTLHVYLCGKLCVGMCVYMLIKCL